MLEICPAQDGDTQLFMKCPTLHLASRVMTARLRPNTPSTMLRFRTPLINLTELEDLYVVKTTPEISEPTKKTEFSGDKFKIIMLSNL